MNEADSGPSGAAAPARQDAAPQHDDSRAALRRAGTVTVDATADAAADAPDAAAPAAPAAVAPAPPVPDAGAAAPDTGAAAPDAPSVGSDPVDDAGGRNAGARARDADGARETDVDGGADGATDADVSSEGGGGGLDGEGGSDGDGDAEAARRKRRRGSRGGQRRRKPAADDIAGDGVDGDGDDDAGSDDRPGDAELSVGEGPTRGQPRPGPRAGAAAPRRSANGDQPELPESLREGRVRPEVAEQALVRKPQIGDTRPAPPLPAAAPPAAAPTEPSKKRQNRRRGAKRTDDAAAGAPAASGASGSGTSGSGGAGGTFTAAGPAIVAAAAGGADAKKRKSQRPGKRSPSDAAVVAERRGQERNGKAIGRYLMCVQVRDGMAQVAVLEGRNLIEHYVSRPADDVTQIHGNIYVGRVQNVLPGMEAAFVDIATPKNAVLYRGDVQYDAEDIESNEPRIEQLLKAKQLMVCQVTKNPIGAKGARLTQEVSLPGRFVVLIPNSKTYGISKRLPDDVRKRLRNILDRVKPAQHGLIVRTAAEHATEDELTADMQMLLGEWEQIAARAATAKQPMLLYREPELAVRVIREEFNSDYRGVVIDDERLHEQVRNYVAAFNPELADRIEYFDPAAEGLSLFEHHHVHEQVHKALDRKVWLPSGGSLIIEHTEALTVIDVNTGKNVGTSSLEETVFHNNLEAAEEIAKQLRLRDIGGIIVIDFIDMEIRDNRDRVVEVFRDALARDKTRSQVFPISELGLVEMTRKRIGEGLLTEFSQTCAVCEGRGVIVDHALLD